VWRMAREKYVAVERRSLFARIRGFIGRFGRSKSRAREAA
jgi:hypothetical protein